MPTSLHDVLQAIASIRNEQDLQPKLMDEIGAYFGVQRWGIYLIDSQLQTNQNTQSIPAVCLESNPVGRYVVERHAPTHEQLILTPEDWQDFCPRHDHGHVMTGPIICDGRLIGTLNFARDQGNPPFNTNDLADLSAVCIHLSAKLATLKSNPQPSQPPLSNPLTPRELQIAELVAKGLTNTEIAEKLWITQNSVKQALKRMFRKLGVSARTEMVARLQDLLLHR
ncbi:LuxR C-terminal-related transcriptional regulator [Nostoc sp. TCL26-01]|uniref:LuxR C-terminal-related transcriptional regulator n=1 Tax=Nostoc sp. TCL26-01 TaxID=2576904 RepID=UPI0015B900B5|nr:LuxR C-terminal-related transcriptional regulator [Nostoc sp. TCL26-01]QLE54570.1 GAF domain-containing protein [Nostoc sp. TCL26-01]